MADDQEKQAASDKLKAKAFEKLKDELRANPDFQRMLYRMRPLDTDAVVETAKELAEHTWPKVLSAADNYIPVIDHPDERVRDLTLRLIIDRLAEERRPIPRLLAQWMVKFLGVEQLTRSYFEEVEPRNVPDDIKSTASQISKTSICVAIMVEIGIQCAAAQEAEFTATRNYYPSETLHKETVEYSVCDAVRDLLNEQGIKNARGHPMTYEGVLRSWQRARKYFSAEPWSIPLDRLSSLCSTTD